MKENFNILKVFVLLVIISIISTFNVYAYDYYPDDIYEGNYSLEEMLQNYSVITFGRNEVNGSTGISKGDVKLFHINSQFLINGKLTNDGENIRTDFRNGNSNLKSYVKSTDKELYCGNGAADSCNKESTLYSNSQFNYDDKSTVVGNYINFDRLYEKIVDSQSRIPKGRELSFYITSIENRYADNIWLPIQDQHFVDGVATYYIDDSFFESDNYKYFTFSSRYFNENRLVIITIDKAGTVKLPNIRQETPELKNAFYTNDYYGMERPNSDYANHFVQESYYGNLIWNIPNATRVELPSRALVGHIIAPNADIVSPENQFAGAIIANSISFVGNSEAHFYPLKITNIPYISNTDYYKVDYEIDESLGSFSYSDGLNPEELQEGMVVTFTVTANMGYQVSDIIIKDQEGNKIEYRKISDTEYEFVMPATNVSINPVFEKRKITNLITNPKTGFKMIIFLIIITVIGTMIYLYQKKESKKI